MFPKLTFEQAATPLFCPGLSITYKTFKISQQKARFSQHIYVIKIKELLKDITNITMEITQHFIFSHKIYLHIHNVNHET